MSPPTLIRVKFERGQRGVRLTNEIRGPRALSVVLLVLPVHSILYEIYVALFHLGKATMFTPYHASSALSSLHPQES